jgi:hypothetical protein
VLCLSDRGCGKRSKEEYRNLNEDSGKWEDRLTTPAVSHRPHSHRSSPATRTHHRQGPAGLRHGAVNHGGGRPPVLLNPPAHRRCSVHRASHRHPRRGAPHGPVSLFPSVLTSLYGFPENKSQSCFGR